MLHAVLAAYILCFAGGMSLIVMSLFTSRRFSLVSFRDFAMLFAAATLILVVARGRGPDGLWHPRHGAYRLNAAIRAPTGRLPRTGPGRRRPKKLRAAAVALEKAGAFALVLELLPPELAAEITGQAC